MDAITKFLWTEETNLLQAECGPHIQRLLSALAVGGSASAQNVLSTFILHLGSLDTSDGSADSCLQMAIEVAHRIQSPNKRLFDALYSFASEMGDNRVGAAALLALGSLSRGQHDSSVDGGCQSDSMSARASNLFQRRFDQLISKDILGESLHKQSTMKMANILNGATQDMREHVMAATRSLSRSAPPVFCLSFSLSRIYLSLSLSLFLFLSLSLSFSLSL